MIEETAPPFPTKPPSPPDISKPIFKFERNDWMDPPVFTQIDPNLTDSVYRRQANDALYRQISSPSKWQKYVTLGYFAIDDGAVFDLEWSAREANPTKMHSIIWYNYLYHIDRELDIPTKLNAWAIQVSQPYLQLNAPHYLLTDTHTLSWPQTQTINNPMEIEEDEWTEVIPNGKARATKRRASSLAKAAAQDPSRNAVAEYNPTGNNTTRASINATNPTSHNNTQAEVQPNETINDTSTGPNDRSSSKGNTHPWSQKNSTQELGKTSNSHTQNSTTTNINQKAYIPHPNKKINDGTHRITFKWKLEKHYLLRLEENADQLIHEIHQLITHALEDDDGLIYPWKSNEHQQPTTVSTLTLEKTKQLLSPNIAFIKSTSLIIFGLRFGFAGNPSTWKFKQTTQTCMKSFHFNASVSNSTCDSGKMVTVGYILLKAPNTTNTLFYLQHLINKLPNNTPYFDILRLRKTPMDQDINHLGVQCGESHAIPLCQALSQYLTGHQTALFLPRYALGSITDVQIKQQFEVHEKYTKSLRAFSLFPCVSNLDRIRTETFPDGKIIERSTREWAATLTTEDNSPALCDVVNGGPDQKATLLVPRPYYDHIKIQYKNYKTRLNPTYQREARYRASIPDLPEVIHITANVKSNLDFLSNLAATTNVWKNTSSPSNLTGEAIERTIPIDNRPRDSWPSRHTTHHHTSQRLNRQQAHTSESTSGRLSNDLDDQSIGSTQSMTRASNATYQARIHELEAILKKQQQVLDSSAKVTTDRISTIERQFSRLDDMDTKLTSMGIQLDHVTTCHATHSKLLTSLKKETNKQFKEMGDSMVNSITTQSNMVNTMMEMQNRMDKITEFMEKLTTRLDFTSTQTVQPINDTTSALASPNLKSDQLPDTQSPPLTTEHSQASTSSSGSFTDRCYSSPQKKKIRSPAEATESNHPMSLCHSDSDEDDNTTITTTTSTPKTRTTLNKRLFSQKESQQHLAAIFNKPKKTGTEQTIKAPPVTRKNKKSGSDGAASL